MASEAREAETCSQSMAHADSTVALVHLGLGAP